MTKTDQRTETEKDRAPSRKTEKLQQTIQMGQQYTQGPHPPIRSKRTVQSENCRKGQRPSVGANWIPGGHLRFQRLSNSKPWQNAVESQAKNKSSLAKCLSGTGLCHAIRSENFKIQVLPTLPTNLTSPLLRLATAAYAEKYGSMTSRWCRVLAPILLLSRG